MVVELSHERAAMAEARGFPFVTGDATEEQVLHQAGIERAKVLVSVMPNDAENVFITLTARQMCPKLVIIARPRAQHAQETASRPAPTTSSCPPRSARTGSFRSDQPGRGRSLPSWSPIASSVAIEMDELLIAAVDALAGQSLRDADIKRRTGVIVVAIKRADGRLEFPPTGDEIFAPGDSVVLLGQRDNLQQFREQLRGEPHGAGSRDLAVITASRTGSSCGPSCGRTSCARPCGRRGSGSRHRAGPARGRGGIP